MNNLAKTHILVADWREQRNRYMINLGAWLYEMRKGPQGTGESLEVMVQKGRAAGRWINTAMLSRLEALRHDDPDEMDELPRQPDFLDVLFLVRYYGASLAEIEHYLLTSEQRDASEQQTAERLARAYLMLPAEQRALAEQYMTFLAQQVSAKMFPPDEQLRRPRRNSAPSPHMPSMAKEQARLDAARTREPSARELASAPTDGK